MTERMSAMGEEKSRGRYPEIERILCEGIDLRKAMRGPFTDPPSPISTEPPKAQPELHGDLW